jgi:protein-disulfide isomerase
MLSAYQIQNAATHIENKENDLMNIELPFVAFSGGDFVLVYKVDSDNVRFLRNGKKLSIPVVQFIQSWSGIILLAEISPDSGEPDYKEHRKKDLLILAQWAIIAVAGILIVVMAYINNVLLTPISPISTISPVSPHSILGVTLLLSVNLIGIYICYLLILKQLHIQSRYADKICTLFSKSDCNNVLESDGSKLWGIFGWSEIGLGYFTANIIIFLFLPHLIPYVAVINISALPFTVWSVWYQKIKAQQWCPLCLIILFLLWTICIINIVFGFISIPAFFLSFSVLNSQFLICIYALSIFAPNLLIPKLSESNKIAQLRQEINSIKANKEIFSILLKKQPYYEVSKSDSQILFGNPDAKLVITILTNPICNPCAKMHARIDKMINRRGESVSSPKRETTFCIQYIFSAFNENFEYANKYFNAIYFEKDKEAAWQLYSDWFEKGKSLKESFFNDLKLDMSNPAIVVEFQKHESWKEKTQLRATPTILVNGFKLPDNYKIEDLRFFTEVEMNLNNP